ncbi:hypothetical protein PC39_08309 [Salinisphaera sp. PC39]
MSFEKGKRYGRYWDDVHTLNDLITRYAFHTTGKNERDFENGFASTLLNSEEGTFNAEVITQIDKSVAVKGVYCFGKQHRPDMSLDENGIAVEIKFVKYAGLKDAIGQGYLYRLRYRFVILVLIISEERKGIYEDLILGKESDLEHTLQHLADNMNVFTYIVPAYKLKGGQKKCVSFFEPRNIVDE